MGTVNKPHLAMGISKLLTNIFRPCTSTPKSPDPRQNGDNIAAPEMGSAAGAFGETPLSPEDGAQKECGGKETPPNADKVIGYKEQHVTPASNKKPDESDVKADKAVPELTQTDKAEVKVESYTQLVALDGEQEAAGPDHALILEVFGFEVAGQLKGKAWDERAEGLKAVRARVETAELGGFSLDKFFLGCCSVAQVVLMDKVMPVYLDALELAKSLLGDFAQSQAIEQDLVRESVHTLVPIIVAKSSDRNTRSIEGTTAALLFVAKQPLVGCSPVMTHMLMTVSSVKEVSLIRGRLELISQFIREFGFSKTSGMSLSSVMAFVRPHLDAADEKVRRSAVEVTVQCYQLKGERTRKFCANLKPALLKLLEQRFTELDGSGGTKPKAPGVLPELRGSSRGLPKLSIQSRGSSRESTGSLGVPLNPLGRPSSNESTSSIRARALVMQEETVCDPFSPAMDDPNFIPSPTDGQRVLSKEEQEDEDFLKEIENI